MSTATFLNNSISTENYFKLCQVQRDARALSEHTPGVEPVSDRRKWQKAEPADSKEAAYCGRQKHRSYGHERLFGVRPTAHPQ